MAIISLQQRYIRYGIMAVFCIFLLSLGIQYCAGQAIYATNAEDERFLKATADLARSLQAKNARRLSPLRAVNSSYENTQKALGLFDDPKAEKDVNQLLTTARDQYGGNFLASLFLGVYAYGRGDLENAVPHFQVFMQKSLFPSQVEKELISDEQTSYFRSFIETTLTKNGYPLEAPTLPLEYKFKRGLQRLHVFPDESLAGTILAMCVFTGLAFIMFNSIFRVFDPHSTPLYVKQFAARIYFILVLAYIAWLVHLFFGINPLIGGSLVKEIVTLITVGTLLVTGHILYSYLNERNKIRNDPDLIICPHCKQPQSRINVVCAHCNKSMD
ncbi:MAG: hypothetical protein JW938_03810 [Candidatus Omnitrophica bacterium]|nr:hypothetical protein [Candidatus Omnitrophota bacterium]